jgi:Tfp pilus assembly protein PilO
MIQDVKKTNFKLKMFLSILFYLVILFVAVIVFIMPSIEYIKSASKKIIENRIDEEKYIQSKKEFKNLETKLSSIDYKVQNIDKYFIKKDNELDFIKSLEDLATKDNIEQKITIDYGAFNSKETYINVPTQLNISGDFVNILNYISDLAGMNYFTNIKNISLTKSSGAIMNGNGVFDTGNTNIVPQGTKIDANIILDTYWK